MATQVSFLTALGPNGPDDGEAGRQQRGMAIAAVVPIQKNRLGYQVPSQSGNGSYVVSVDDQPFCTCPDFEKRQERCKHVYAVEFIIQREERPDGDSIETKTMRVTYRQDWPAYNAAQTHEQEQFLSCCVSCAIPSPAAANLRAAPAATLRRTVRYRTQGVLHYVWQAGYDRLP